MTSPSGTTCDSGLGRLREVSRRQSVCSCQCCVRPPSGWDVIVGCAGMLTAALWIAEIVGIPYFYTAYAPVALPSEHHSPPPVHGPPRLKGYECPLPSGTSTA